MIFFLSCRKNSQRRNKINTILHQAFGGAPPDFGSISASEDSDEENEHGKVNSRMSDLAYNWAQLDQMGQIWDILGSVFC